MINGKEKESALADEFKKRIVSDAKLGQSSLGA